MFGGVLSQGSLYRLTIHTLRQLLHVQTTFQRPDA